MQVPDAQAEGWIGGSGAVRVLITGASGFIGRRLIARWSGGAAGELRCLVRDRAGAVHAGVPPDSIVTGDLADARSLQRAVEDVDVVVHLAALVKAARVRDLFATNVGGTRLLLAACPGVPFVHVSSLAAAGPSVDGAGSAVAPEACRPCSRYGESKRQSELAVVADAARTGRRWLVLRPCVVYGPGDAATRVLTAQARAWLTATPPRPRPLSVIHVDDVCDAIRLAVQAEASGHCLPLVHPTSTDTHTLLRAIAAAWGRRARLVPVPLPLARAAAALAQAGAALRGRATFFNLDKVREIAAAGWVGDPGPAQAVLGFRAAIGLEDGLAALARSGA